ncbi:YegP family protein [Ancylobacter sp. G4_0304]|uniref:YegP family protein n=1 Tax=Ancylobacter sp. G4_0304 TaxID=3114289 RepID=UPI0039C716D8
MAYKFEVYQDKAGGYRFRFKASNGETMFASESYKAKASALSAIDSIKKNTPGADVVELPKDETKA